MNLKSYWRKKKVKCDSTIKLDCYIHMKELIRKGKLPNTANAKKWFITMAKINNGDCSICNLENINLS